MNYTNALKPREDLMVEFSKPIAVNDYKELYEENPSKAILAINEDIYKALEERAIIIEEKESEKFAEQYLEMTRNNNKIPMFPIYGHNPLQFEIEKKASERINILFRDFKEKFNTISTSANDYFNKLKEYNISDRDIVKKQNTCSYFVF